jgi:predicted nucleic acid-binding protein
MMLFDTDVLIWALCGYENAKKEIDNDDNRFISAVTYMELVQGARNKKEQVLIKKFLSTLGFEILPITENISCRATVLMEEYALKSGIQLADALIFATACENSLRLCSANKKHFKGISSLDAKEFKPGDG